MLGEFSQQSWDKLLLNLTFSTFSVLVVLGGRKTSQISYISSGIYTIYVFNKKKSSYAYLSQNSNIHFEAIVLKVKNAAKGNMSSAMCASS